MVKQAVKHIGIGVHFPLSSSLSASVLVLAISLVGVWEIMGLLSIPKKNTTAIIDLIFFSLFDLFAIRWWLTRFCIVFINKKNSEPYVRQFQLLTLITIFVCGIIIYIVLCDIRKHCVSFLFFFQCGS